MKNILKKMLKTLLVFVVSTITIYLLFTITAFYKWGNENQLFINTDNLLVELDDEKIQELGDGIGSYAQLLEDSLNEQSEEYDSIAEYYDPLGFSVWSHIRSEIENILNYRVISVLSGIAIAVAYAVITSKKMNNILKFALGYFGIILIIPPIYMYSWTYRFWDIATTYRNMPIYFYIGYTLIFILMYAINYRIGKKMTKDLNQAIKNSNSFDK